MILNAIFGFDLPVVRVCIAIFLFYLGFKMLFGSFGIHIGHHDRKNMALFRSGEFRFQADSSDSDHPEYNIIFGKGFVDLREINLTKPNTFVEINTVFGETTVQFDHVIPIEIITHSVFANTTLPDKDINAFGRFHYQSENFDKNQNHITVRANTVFGSLRFIKSEKLE